MFYSVNAQAVGGVMKRYQIGSIGSKVRRNLAANFFVLEFLRDALSSELCLDALKHDLERAKKSNSRPVQPQKCCVVYKVTQSRHGLNSADKQIGQIPSSKMRFTRNPEGGTSK